MSIMPPPDTEARLDGPTLRRLEFPAVLRLLARHTSFGPGRELALATTPAATRPLTERRQAETAAARRLLEEGGAVDFGGARDIIETVERARRGGLIDGASLKEVGDTAAASGSARKKLLQADDPILHDLGGPLGDFSSLVKSIGEAVDDEGMVRDRASSGLAAARRRIRGLQSRIKDRLDAMVRSPRLAPYLQEQIVTIRDDRYVLPVKAEYRRHVRGLVHSRSASGATVFIEPMGIVELNNEVLVAKADEEREVVRVLTDLSARVAAHADALLSSLDAMAYADAVFARARLAVEMDAVQPHIGREPEIYLPGARHPLLDPDPVPIDIRLGGRFSTLIITGPNTGGKTVSLKTAGLLVCMAQSGLQVPAEPGCRLGVFRQVFADIGDEQSIVQSLSTFSAHLSNVVSFIERVEEGALVLLDEIGAGTDPDEGAALAMALLDYFRRRGALTMATTHYGRLKNYAYEHPGVENASVEFDPDTLAPTYRLIIGAPGRSNALTIATRLGMPGAVVSAARAYLGDGAGLLDEALAQVEDRRLQVERDRRRLDAKEEELAAMGRALEERRAGLEERRRQWLEKRRAEIAAALNKMMDDADRAMHQLRQAAAAGDAAGAEKVGEQTRRILREVQRETARMLAPEPEPRADGMEGAPGIRGGEPASRRTVRGESESGKGKAAGVPGLERGGRVWVIPLNREGELLDEPVEGKSLSVQLGPMRVQVDYGDLRPLGGGGPEHGSGGGPSAPRAGAVLSSKARNISPEVDIRGLSVAEALPRVDKYLDDAFLAGLDDVRIIHGKGTGVLRREVGRYLADHPRVKKIAPAPPRQGGAGATLVRLYDG